MGPRPRGTHLVEWAFTDRLAGLSAPPYDGANLGTHVGDDPDAVASNRARLTAEFDLSPECLVVMSQVHGRDVAVIGDPPDTPPQVDALVTDVTELALVTQVADCVPILLASDAGVIAAVHSGWRGVVAGVVDASVERLRAVGEPDAGIHAWIGPSICPGCYEVGDDVRDAVSAAAPAAYATTRHGTAAVDVGAGVAEQLARQGVSVEVIPGCTFEDEHLFSFRRDRATGRQAGVIVMRAVADPERAS
jgi:polyphenol oxidase